MALIGESSDSPALEQVCRRSGGFFMAPSRIRNNPILLSRYQRILGEPGQTTGNLMNELVRCLPACSIGGIKITGAGGQSMSRVLNLDFENEFNAAAYGVRAICPQACTIMEMGGNSSKYIRILDDDDRRSGAGILDYEKNGDCAAGTGSFIDQQSSRLCYPVEEIGRLVLSVDTAATIAGRCTVFSKTDMVHAQQRGFTPPQILKGLCEAVVRNFKGTVIKGKQIIPPVILIGGMAANAGIVQAIQKIFALRTEDLIVPEEHAWMSAIGAGFSEMDSGKRPLPMPDISERIERLEKLSQKNTYAHPGSPPLSVQNLVLLRNEAKNYSFENRSLPVDAFLGIDVGSVSTNLAVIDGEGALIHSIYMRTKSRPIEVVQEGLLQIHEALADRVRITGVGTTGSGRELIGQFVGADIVKDEITAHKTGAVFIARNLLDSEVDTIFEIGGQDSKFIRLEKGIVVDFSMNEACSAGTGSFLEEQAERLGIRIEDEFASIALNSENPVRLGERCTVFMEKDVISHLQRGAEKGDLTAGLAYSIALNYLNRVVRGRKIGDVVFFQGGTAYNDAVAAAFSNLLNKKIIVPPYNGVIGAVGAALLARQQAARSVFRTQFRGYDLSNINYDLREFVCKGCSNSCTIQEFRVGNERTYWGDKCSQRYRKRPKTNNRPVIPDLFALREELLRNDAPELLQGARIGIPRCMYYYDHHPFWRTFFNKIGCRVIVSDPTNRKLVEDGIETAVAEPCFPIQVAHGHVRSLMGKDADFIFVPNVINSWTDAPETASYLCPWGQTLPFVLAGAPALSEIRKRILMPTIHFQEGIRQVKRELVGMATSLGASPRRSDIAVEAAFEEQRKFSGRLMQAGAEALRELNQRGRMGIVMLARPYTLYDRYCNLDLPLRIRDIYGVNIIPMDFLDVDSVDIKSLHPNMFWNYGRKILQASKIVQENANLHLIYLTNFKCGPDSFIGHFVEHISNKPFLTLQFDGHSNDAGAITRCEAYLESKGFL
jgi:predicted CoA-substrate-specific enzyme activase